MTRQLSDEERLDWLQLIRSDGIGPMTFFQLLSRFVSAAAALDALPDLTSRTQLNPIPRDVVAREFELTRRFGARFIARCEPDYPQALAAISDPPPVIAVRGPGPIDQPGIGIVGPRNASASGCRMAKTLAQQLGEAGYTIISGLARGIDGSAHAAAIPTGTIAVIAGGIDQVYPPEHAGLYQAICEQGAVISEVRFGHVARARDFPKRNRIVSGLSRGVIVVEAAERSGTLITARLANEQGRDVFAVPGSPLDPRSAGTNRLIRQGAVLIRDADDVIEELKGQRELFAEPQSDFFASPDDGDEDPDQLRRRIQSLLSVTPTHRDELVRQSDATAASVSAILLDLILEGIAIETDGGQFALYGAD